MVALHVTDTLLSEAKLPPAVRTHSTAFVRCACLFHTRCRLFISYTCIQRQTSYAVHQKFSIIYENDEQDATV